MKICFRCHVENPKRLADHKADCPLLQDKKNSAKQVSKIAARYRRENTAHVTGSHGHINRKGQCKKCGALVPSLMLHLGKCPGPRPPDADA